MLFAEQFELLSDRLDDNGGGGLDGVNNDFEETEEEFEAHFDPLNEVELKVRSDRSGLFSLHVDCDANFWLLVSPPTV